MGVAELRKAELYYHKSVQEDVAKTLQHSGACQIIEETKSAGNASSDIANRLSACEERLTHIRYLFRALGSCYTDPVSSLDRLLGERPVFSITELAETAQKTDLGELASSVKKMEATLNELRLEISQLTANASILRNIKDFPYSLDILGDGSRTVRGISGFLPAEQVEHFRTTLSASFAAETEAYFAPRLPGKRDAWTVVMYSRTHEREVTELCGRSGMTFVELPGYMRGTVSEEETKIANRLQETQKREKRLLQDLKDLAYKCMPVVQQLSDYWSILCERYQALGLSDATDRTLKTSFWVPVEALPNLKKQLEALSPNLALMISAPTAEDTPPTLLKNNYAIRPFEALTNLYSPPPYGETDPTPLLAPFFFIFFGMCLGDAGYAIVMLGAFWMLFKKYRRIPQNVKEFILLFVFGAVSTFIYGVLSGSFFGDFIDAFAFMSWLRPLKDGLLVVDPMKNPMQVLGLALFLGLVHLMFGLGIAAFDHIRKKNYVDAVGDKISWILFVVGLALILVGSAGALPAALYFLAKVMALAGAAIIFWYAGREKKGIFSKALSGFLALYGSTSYMGDVLSYSRLLALGFGSAVIGMIINLLGGMAAGIPYVGWIVAIAVVVGGHLFGVIINILGAFVHSLRLQYVEFFGKFYGGGGTFFKPLTLETRYVELTEQNPKA